MRPLFPQFEVMFEILQMAFILRIGSALHVMLKNRAGYPAGYPRVYIK